MSTPIKAFLIVCVAWQAFVIAITFAALIVSDKGRASSAFQLLASFAVIAWAGFLLVTQGGAS